MAQQSLVVARPSSASFTYNGTEYELTKLLDGDYLNLTLTSGEVIKFVKGVGGNAAGAFDMQATISQATCRIMNNDPFAEELLKLATSVMTADGESMSKLTLTDIQFNFYYESDGELTLRKFGAAYGTVSVFPNMRANASGDATQTVFQFTIKMPSGCLYKGKEVL